MIENHTEITNVYSEHKVDKEKNEKQYKKVYKPRERSEDKPKEDDTKYDSDGFEIINTVKTKPEDFKPKKRYDRDRRDNDRPYRGNNRGGNKFQGRRQRSQEKEQKPNEENDTPVENKEDIEANPEPVKKSQKETISIPSNAKKLKDLFA
jgi:hypothetical protein